MWFTQVWWSIIRIITHSMLVKDYRACSKKYKMWMDRRTVFRKRRQLFTGVRQFQSFCTIRRLCYNCLKVNRHIDYQVNERDWSFLLLIRGYSASSRKYENTPVLRTRNKYFTSYGDVFYITRTHSRTSGVHTFASSIFRQSFFANFE